MAKLQFYLTYIGLLPHNVIFTQNNSGELRKIRDCCIFSINNLAAF